MVLGPQAALSALSGHSWLDPRGSGSVVGAPGLVNYSMHSDLGRVVQVIKRELAKAPIASAASPANNPTTTASPSKLITSKPHLGAVGRAFSASQLQVPSAATNVSSTARQAPPQVPAAAPSGPKRQTYVSSITGLDELPDEELKAISSGASRDAAARLFCREMKNPTRDRHGKMLEAAREDVEKLLHENAELESQVDTKRDALAKKLREAGRTKQEVASLHASLAEQSRSLSPSVMVDRMRISSLEAEEASDALAESFLAGECEVERFLKEYVSARSLVHTRKVKLDQLRKLRPPSAND